jgi:hypothetical protein
MTRFPTLLLGTLAIALPFAANASVMRAIDFDTKVDHAAAIVLGKCVKTRSEWDPSHRTILTWSTFQVEETLKGTPAAEVTVVTPGGVVGDVHQDTVGIRPFREGSENVVFVRNTSIGPTVLYFDQGAYDVATDDRGDKIVAPVETNVIRVDTQRGVAVESERARTLREFKSDIHDSVERTRGMKMEMVRGREQQTSFLSAVAKYKLLVALALMGALLATWQFVRRA